MRYTVCRQQLAEREAELEQLRSEMAAQMAKSSPVVVLDGIKRELQAVTERNKVGKLFVYVKC